jgi:hypothetical protein
MSAHDVSEGEVPSARGVADVEPKPPAPPSGTLLDPAEFADRETATVPPSRHASVGSSSHPVVIPTDVDQTRQRASLAALHNALGRMVDDIDRLADNGDLFGLADGYAELDAFLKAARDVRNHAEDHIAAMMTQDRMNLDDEITLERRSGKKRREWDWDGVLKALGAQRWIDPETGEYVAGTLKDVVSLTASVSPRVGALRDRGVDVDQYCEESPARTTVYARKANP